MVNNGIQRKLKAIFSADVHGYSKLMGDDDEYTVNTITAYREIITELIEKYQGRVVDAPGDNLLAEFGSSLNAIQSAIEVQRTLETENGKLPGNRRMDFRIGINLGDVLHKDDRIYGDGVNIASRIENLADPGGICISRGVYEQVDEKLDVGFTDLGPHSVKNIKKPINIYKVLLDPKDAGKIIDTPKPRTLPHKLRIAAVAALVMMICIVGWFTWFRMSATAFEPAEMSKMAFPLPEQPSLVVVPFKNLTGDPAQQTFVNGFTESIIGALTQVPDILLIDRGSSFAFDSETAQVKDFAEKFGVRYVLRGSILRSNDRIRIQTQLVDALSGRAVWGKDYDRHVGDIFDLHDEITQEILSELEVTLTQGEQARIRRRQTENLDAYIAFMQGVEHFHTFTADEQVKAENLFKKAIELDPKFASAHALLGYAYLKQARNSWVNDVEKARRMSEINVARALELDPNNIDALGSSGQILMDAGKHEEAIQSFRKAARLAPNYVDNLAPLSLFLAMSEGDPNEVETIVKRAMRISPDYPNMLLSALAWAHYFRGELDEAIKLSEARHKLMPNSEIPLIHLMLMNAKAGRMDEARDNLSALRRLQPKYSIVHFDRFMKPFFKSATYSDLVTLLKKVGVSDNP